MKVLDKIKKYWMEGLIVIASVFVLSTSIKNNIHLNRIEDLNRSALKAEVVDSIVSDRMRRESAVLDSIMRVEANKTSRLSAEIGELKKELKNARIKSDKLQLTADSIYAAYNSGDSIPCSDVIDSYVEANESIKEENAILETENTKLEQSNNSLVVQLDASKNMVTLRDSAIVYKDKLIDTKTAIIREYEKKDNWFNKNDRWIFGVAGAVIGVLIAK